MEDSWEKGGRALVLLFERILWKFLWTGFREDLFGRPEQGSRNVATAVPDSSLSPSSAAESRDHCLCSLESFVLWDRYYTRYCCDYDMTIVRYSLFFFLLHAINAQREKKMYALRRDAALEQRLGNILFHVSTSFSIPASSASSLFFYSSEKLQRMFLIFVQLFCFRFLMNSNIFEPRNSVRNNYKISVTMFRTWLKKNTKKTLITIRSPSIISRNKLCHIENYDLSNAGWKWRERSIYIYT